MAKNFKALLSVTIKTLTKEMLSNLMDHISAFVNESSQRITKMPFLKATGILVAFKSVESIAA